VVRGRVHAQHRDDLAPPGVRGRPLRRSPRRP
jgi:hypothetical protein